MTSQIGAITARWRRDSGTISGPYERGMAGIGGERTGPNWKAAFHAEFSTNRTGEPMAVRTIDDEGVSLYPLDIAALEKGDVIPPELCERHLGMKRTDIRYGQSLVSFRDLVLRGLRRMGRQWTVTTPQSSVKILTDSEAASYNRKEFNRYTSAAGRRFRDNLGVDPSRLQADERRTHEHTLTSQATQLEFIRRAKRQVSLTAHKRATPGLPPQEGEAAK